ncbi:MAG: hypothetical protein U1E03_07585 [Hyphomonadaceae bacterium]
MCTILTIGRSPAVRTVVPYLLEPLHCTMVTTDDALSAVHVLERLRTDHIIIDAEADPLDSEGFAKLKARIPHLSTTTLHVLRTRRDDADVVDLLARARDVWTREKTDSKDLHVLLPALLSCVERAAY